MNYQLYQNKNSKSKAYGKYYARAAYNGHVETDDIAEVIQRNCSMKRSDVLAVIAEMVEVMTDKLQEGYIVKLNGFGSFKIGLTSTGTVTPDQFSANKNITGAHVNFLPTWEVNTATGDRNTTFISGLRLKELAQPEE